MQTKSFSRRFDPGVTAALSHQTQGRRPESEGHSFNFEGRVLYVGVLLKKLGQARAKFMIF